MIELDKIYKNIYGLSRLYWTASVIVDNKEHDTSWDKKPWGTMMFIIQYNGNCSE